jgi:hypothetical protein
MKVGTITFALLFLFDVDFRPPTYYLMKLFYFTEEYGGEHVRGWYHMYVGKFIERYSYDDFYASYNRTLHVYLNLTRNYYVAWLLSIVDINTDGESWFGFDDLRDLRDEFYKWYEFDGDGEDAYGKELVLTSENVRNIRLENWWSFIELIWKINPDKYTASYINQIIPYYVTVYDDICTCDSTGDDDCICEDYAPIYLDDYDYECIKKEEVVRTLAQGLFIVLNGGGVLV